MIYPPLDDSLLLAEQVKKHCFGKEVLDMGTGSGIQAETALNNNAKSILSADINEESTPILKKKGIKFIHSDLFSNISGEFDLIIFNPPYLPLDEREDKEGALTNAGGKKGDELILRFLKQAILHLKKEGIILLVVSSLTPQKEIKKFTESFKDKCNQTSCELDNLFIFC